MVTCLGDVLRPEVGIATVRLLQRLGHEVAFSDGQTCCGQPFFNSGYLDLARAQAQHTIAALAGDEPVVVPSGSCAAMVKNELAHLLADDQAWHERATNLASRTYELADFLLNVLGTEDVGARYEGRVTYHDACHLRGLALSEAPVRLIRRVSGLTYVALERLDQCCGFGGSFAVRYGSISTAMVDDKVNCILATGAEAVVSTDTGCLMNIAGRLRRLGQPVRTLHLAELLAGQ